MIGEENSLIPLTALPPKKQLAFALLAFERMLPSLTTFSKATGFNDECYLHAAEAAWQALQNGAVDQGLNQACLRGAPDTEQFTHELTSQALNAALAMSEIVEFVFDERVDHIVSILTLMRDSLHLYLSSLDPSRVSSPENDRPIACHPLMQFEQHRKEKDIEYLSGLPEQFDKNAISALRTRANSQAPLLPIER
jgi:uncharacterized protein